ncbi:MAG: efflux RND transporter periplasmic adaptor subunit, partial [Flavobacteriaceae bacterium]
MRKTYFLALAIVIAIGAWMATGDVIVGGEGAASPTAPGETAAEERAPRVATRVFEAGERVAKVDARGRTEADQRVDLRAQVDGLVEELPASKGSTVDKNAVICRIETAARKAALAQAEAAVAQAELDHEAASKLNKKGYAAETRVRALKAQLDAAEAQRTAAQWTLDRTEVRAPIAGRVEALPVETGSYLKAGDLCATIVDSDPMLAVVTISERQIGHIEPGMKAEVRMVDGGNATGEVSYISRTADTATRTFRVEIAVANPDGRFREGVTSDVTIPLKPVSAQLIPSGIIVLDDVGEFGVRT